MFARNLAIQLKPNTQAEFTRTFENDVLPLLRKQKGFQDEIAFSIPGGLDLISISLWDNKENAETYNTAVYPEVLKMLGKVIDGAPKVRISDVIISTFHKIAHSPVSKPVAVTV